MRLRSTTLLTLISPDHLAPTSTHPILSQINPPTQISALFHPCLHHHIHPHLSNPIYPHTPSSTTTPLAPKPNLDTCTNSFHHHPICLGCPHPIYPPHPINFSDQCPSEPPYPVTTPSPHPMSHTQHYQPGLNPTPNLIQLSLTFIGSSLQGKCLGSLFHYTQHS